jgi:hypothetical protein
MNEIELRKRISDALDARAAGLDAESVYSLHRARQKALAQLDRPRPWAWLSLIWRDALTSNALAWGGALACVAMLMIGGAQFWPRNPAVEPVETGVALGADALAGADDVGLDEVWLDDENDSSVDDIDLVAASEQDLDVAENLDFLLWYQSQGGS